MTRAAAPPILRSFRPVADERSRILILGTMPGPVALERRQYYGYPGNHFWKIIPAILSEPAPSDYAGRIDLLRRHRIALWDVLRTCRRQGAGDAAIRDAVPNDIAALLGRHRAIGTIFFNGKSAERLYRRYWDGRIHIPCFALPSTSPAHASQSLPQKTRAWSAILPYLANRNPWC